jgi:hypothetical protein
MPSVTASPGSRAEAGHGNILSHSDGFSAQPRRFVDALTAREVPVNAREPVPQRLCSSIHKDEINHRPN